MNAKGDSVIARQYRDGASKSACDIFRMRVLAAKEVGE